MLAHVAEAARAAGASRLIGVYLPTKKNGMVAEHYGKLGFELVSKDPSGGSTWELDTSVEIEGAPMTIDRSGFEPALAPS